MASKNITPRGTTKVTFSLSNIGQRDGDEVAQICSQHVGSEVSQPKLSLCRFSRVSLKSGETIQVTIKIPAERLRYWSPAEKHYVVEPGDYEFLVGAASDDIRLRLPMTITSR